MKKELDEKQLEKISGGDDLEDISRQSLKDQEEERLKKLLENIENNKQQRTSEELNDLVENLTDILKKLVGTNEDSDGKIHTK